MINQRYLAKKSTQECFCNILNFLVGVAAVKICSVGPRQHHVCLFEVDLGLIEDRFFFMEVVSEPEYVVLLLLDCQIWIFGQTSHNKFHEVANWSLTWKTLLQVFVQEDVLMERNAGFFLKS